jgi:hypothetical protein
MTVSNMVAVVTATASAVGILAFTSGLFLGARLTRAALGSRSQDRRPGSGEFGELVRLLLREVLDVVRELRSSQAGPDASDRQLLPPRVRWLRRR